MSKLLDPPSFRRAGLLPLVLLPGLIGLTAAAQQPPGATSAPPTAQADPNANDVLPEPLIPDPSDEGLLDEAAAIPFSAEEPVFSVPSRIKSPPLGSCKPLPSKMDLLAEAKKRSDGRYVVARGGVDQILTLDGYLHEKLRQILKSYQTPYAAVVAMEPSTGKVLAMAEHSERDPSMRGLTTKAVFPAASIFKIVTASALLDSGIKPEDSECFHGGKRSISERMLQDSARDRACYALSRALAISANGVFAKLTFKHLTTDKLRNLASAFHFNRSFDFPIPTDVSLAAIPEDPLGLAAAGSGFGDIYLSPLHGAGIAAAVANGGLWRAPLLLETDEQAPEAERIISGDTALQLTDMLEQTVSAGTARRIFRERGFRVPGAVGKTGSLADRKPFRDYTWFVGFAPRWNPQIAVAAVVVNEAKWRIRATWLGREAMRLYLEQKNSLANSR